MARRPWVLVALAPYALAYLSDRGSLVAAGHYAAALDTLVNLNRFALYQQLHLRLPASTEDEKDTNAKMANLFDHIDEVIEYEHPVVGDGAGTASR